MLLQCLDSEFDYGYEYAGSADRDVLLLDKTRHNITQALSSGTPVLCLGDQVS